MEMTDDHHTLVPISPAKAPCTQYDWEHPGTTIYPENSLLCVNYSAINFLKKGQFLHILFLISQLYKLL